MENKNDRNFFTVLQIWVKTLYYFKIIYILSSFLLKYFLIFIQKKKISSCSILLSLFSHPIDLWGEREPKELIWWRN